MGRRVAPVLVATPEDRGDTDPVGPSGPAGSDRPDQVATWNIHYESNGATGKQEFNSQDLIPANAYVEALDISVEGDFSDARTVHGLRSERNGKGLAM